jgi:hypothetical protein
VKELQNFNCEVSTRTYVGVTSFYSLPTIPPHITEPCPALAISIHDSPHQTLILENDHHPKSDNWCFVMSDVIAHMEVGVTSWLLGCLVL